MKTSTVYVVYFVAFMDLFGASMVVTLLATYLRDELGLSATVSGLITSLYGVVQFFSSPIVGGESDSHGYRRVLLLCLFACVPSYALLSSTSFFIVGLSRVLSGSFKHTQNLCRTYVAANVRDESLKTQAYGRLNAIGNIGFIIGPALGGWLISKFNYGAVYYLVSVIFLLNGIFVYFYFPTDHPSSKTAANGGPKSDTKSPAGGLIENAMKVDWSKQWDLFLIRFLFSLTALLYRNGFNWELKDRFDVGPDSVSYLTSYQAVTAFISSYFADVVIKVYGGNRIRCLHHSTILLLSSFIGFITSVFLSTYSLFLIPLCVSTSLMRVLSLDLTMERCDNNDRGLVIGVSASVVSVARAISPAISGILHDFHPASLNIIAVLLLSVGFVVSVRYTPRNQIAFINDNKDKSSKNNNLSFVDAEKKRAATISQ